MALAFSLVFFPNKFRYLIGFLEDIEEMNREGDSGGNNKKVKSTMDEVLSEEETVSTGSYILQLITPAST